jgi:hypothetical protein
MGQAGTRADEHMANTNVTNVYLFRTCILPRCDSPHINEAMHTVGEAVHGSDPAHRFTGLHAATKKYCTFARFPDAPCRNGWKQ